MSRTAEVLGVSASANKATSPPSSSPRSSSSRLSSPVVLCPTSMARARANAAAARKARISPSQRGRFTTSRPAPPMTPASLPRPSTGTAANRAPPPSRIAAARCWAKKVSASASAAPGISSRTSPDVPATDSARQTTYKQTMSKSRILYLFTRTPLHVGAGSSVGAIDQPIQRERHTGFPVIPASSLKGTFADAWNGELHEESNDRGGTKKVRVRQDGSVSAAAWLFGSDSDKHPFAGAVQFSEARLLAFPIRSARGSFAWVTCPLALARAVRDGVPGVKAIEGAALKVLTGDKGDEHVLFAKSGPLTLGEKVVLEEYTFTHAGEVPPGLSDALAKLLKEGEQELDPVWKEVASRLVILSDGMMSFFVQNACEVAQHVRISDETD